MFAIEDVLPNLHIAGPVRVIGLAASSNSLHKAHCWDSPGACRISARVGNKRTAKVFERLNVFDQNDCLQHPYLCIYIYIYIHTLDIQPKYWYKDSCWQPPRNIYQIMVLP